jgi:folate-binding protein YgfZ
MEDFFYRNSRPTIIRAQGEDAEDYLQSQWSIDLRKMEEGGVRFGLRLSLKGKVLAGAYLIRLEEEEFLLIAENMPLGALLEMLEENVVADEVEFSDESENWEFFSLKISDPDSFAGKFGSAILTQSKFSNLEDGLFFADDRLSGDGYCALVQKGSVAIDKIREGLEEISESEYDFQRIKGRKYSIPAEVGTDDLPQEAGLEKSFVDFNKGCYLGQEVMARLHAMGKVQRGIIPVRGENEIQTLPSLPAAVMFEKKAVGHLKSLVRHEDEWVGVAKIHLKAKEQLNESGLDLENEEWGKIFSL